MAKDKPFRDALRMQIADAGEDHKALRRIALALMEKAASGDVQAIKEVADRMDGKVPQGVGQDDELGPQRFTIVTGVPRKGDDDESND
jgi:hypothetical protein